MTSEIPLLKSNAKIKSTIDKIVIEYLQQEIVLEGTTADLFGRILPHLDGTIALDGIAARACVELSDVRRLTQELGRTGAVSLLRAPPRADSAPPLDGDGVSGEEFYALHRRYAAGWLQPVYEHPLWERILSGTASRAQVLGFAFEKYHYIEGAYEHMAVAAANATPEMMPHLARHFIEEYTHGDIYRKGLRSLFRDDVVVRSQPLPSTRALINFLSETAGRNSFSYYAGNELLQMTENTSDATDGGAVTEFYAAMRRHYPYTQKLIESFIQHTEADQQLGHESVFAEMCRSVPPLGRREVNDALNTVRSMAEHLLLFMDGIDRAYAGLTDVPRPPCDLLSE